MSTEGENPTADMVEDEVMVRIPSLDATELERVCGEIGLDVKTEVKGNKREIKRLLMAYLCTNDDGGDDRTTEFLQIHGMLFPDGKKKEGEPEAAVKVEAVATEEAGNKNTISPVAPVSRGTVEDGRLRPKCGAAETVHTEITRYRGMKEFKLPNNAMIGGDGDTALSYDSLLFEVEKGRRSGFTDPEMCSTIISKVADKETRSYLETTPDIELEEVLEMLKNVCCTAEGSTALFTQFTNDSQGESEKPINFITRVLRLRRKVHSVGEEEGVTYDKLMLAKRSFEVIFSGLRDENIRSALRERCKDDFSLKDNVIHKYAAKIIVAEKERKLKLFGKGAKEEVEVKAIDTRDRADEEGSRGKKEKLNPFVKIEELRSEMKADKEEIRVELNEIKKLVIANNNAKGGTKGDNEDGDNKKKWKPKKCPACVAANKWRCYHCWMCGKDDHKIDGCPENC